MAAQEECDTMDENIICESKKFLIQYLRGKDSNSKTLFPWRRDWRFVVHHSLRVESYAIKILEGEGMDINERESLLIRTAAVLHDTGRLDGVDDHSDEHGRCGAQIVEKWLLENGNMGFSPQEKDRLLHMISVHSEKDTRENEIGVMILKDADILDEIGAISIFMSSYRIDNNDSNFLNNLSDRLKSYEIKFCNRQMDRLNTYTAKKILSEKKQFIENFIQQLDLELDGTKDLYL